MIFGGRCVGLRLAQEAGDDLVAVLDRSVHGDGVTPVEPGPAVEAIYAEVAVEGVVAAAPHQYVGPWARVDPVGLRSTDHGVVAVAEEDLDRAAEGGRVDIGVTRLPAVHADPADPREVHGMAGRG